MNVFSQQMPQIHLFELAAIEQSRLSLAKSNAVRNIVANGAGTSDFHLPARSRKVQGMYAQRVHSFVVERDVRVILVHNSANTSGDVTKQLLRIQAAGE